MSKNSYLKIIILAVIFGLGAGVVGQLLVDAYLLPPENFISTVGSKIKNEITQTEENQKITEAFKAVSPSVLEIYPLKQNPPAGIANQVYLTKDRTAVGVSLTSDGWLVSSEPALANPKNRYIVMTQDRKFFIPEKIILDEATGAVFLKIDAQNLPIPKLGASENLSLGETVIIPPDGQSLVTAKIQNLSYSKNNDAKDLFLSSEKMSEFFLVSYRSAANGIGAPAVNYAGEVVGLVMDEDGSVVPTDAWRSAFISILRNDKISRPYLGLRYLDIAKTPGLSETESGGQTTGALIWSDAALQIQGVAKNSPAAKADIKNGDIILKINSEEITAKTNLTEIIQDYSPNDEVNFTFLRNGEEKTVKIKLGEK